MTVSTARSRSGSSASSGTRYGMLASRILRFARTSRCAIVASGTRNERAISSVSSPPRRRSVKRDLDVRGQRRVAAREDQPQPVVLHGPDRFGWFVALVEERRLGVSVMAGCLTPEPVDGTVAGRRRDPRTGVRRQSGLRPPLRRHDERLLDRLFGDVDVAEETDQGRRPHVRTRPGRCGRAPNRPGWHDWARRRVPCRDRPGTGGPRPGPCTRPSPSPPTPARRRGRRPR